MISKQIPGGMYVEALPSGEWACVTASYREVLTHFGTLTVPTDDTGKPVLAPLQLRVSNIGGFQFAGAALGKPAVSVWKDGVWTPTPPPPYGLSTAIYDAQGVLHIADEATAIAQDLGVLGWRYVDSVTGALVSGASTYIDSSTGLCEWTDIGDGVRVGQSVAKEVVVHFDGALHLLWNAGKARYIRARRDGDNVALAWVVEDGQPSEIRWTTMMELRALPLHQTTTPPYAHPCLVGPFHNTSRRYGNFDCPGNAEVLSFGYFQDQKIKRPVVAEMDSEFEVPDGWLEAIWYGFEGAVVNEQTVLAFVKADARAQQRKVPLFVYWDANDYPDEVADRFCGLNRFPIVQGYPLEKRPDEPVKCSPDEDVNRIYATCAKLRQRFDYVGFSRPCYTQSGNYPVEHIEAMQGGLTRMCRELKLIFDGWFAYGRDPQHALPSFPAIQAAIFPLAASPRPGRLWQGVGPTPGPEPPVVPTPGPGPEPSPEPVPPINPPQPIPVPTAVLASRTFFRGR